MPSRPGSLTPPARAGREARPRVPAAFAIASRLGIDDYDPCLLCVEAANQLGSGDVSAAMLSLEAAVRVAREVGDPVAEADAIGTRARIAIDRRDDKGVRTNYGIAIELYKQAGLSSKRLGESYAELAQYLEAEGAIEEALSAWKLAAVTAYPSIANAYGPMKLPYPR